MLHIKRHKSKPIH